jgi:flagellar biosynthesis/type III secretory pathway protein FliH
VEKMLEESESLLLDTPYLRRMREIGRELGRAEGQKEGREEGREEGRGEGLQIGLLVGLRETILDGVVRRFDPSASLYRRLERDLEGIDDQERLRQLLFTLFEVDSMDAFMTQIDASE